MAHPRAIQRGFGLMASGTWREPSLQFMKTWLIAFGKALEAAIPPAPKCHHALMYAQHGSDAAGWQDKLALQVGVNGKFYCWFLDDGDFETPVDELVATIVADLARMQENAQVSGTPCCFTPAE